MKGFTQRKIAFTTVSVCVILLIYDVKARTVGYPTTVGPSQKSRDSEYQPGGPSEGSAGGFMDPLLASSVLKLITSEKMEIRLLVSLLGLGERDGATEAVRQLRNDGNVSDFCLLDLVTYSKDLVNMTKYALQMRSSYATLPNLISLPFTGRLRYDGNYELCTGVVRDIDGAPFNGRYCQANRLLPNGRHLQFGICVPGSCDGQDLDVAINSMLTALGQDVGLSFDCVTGVPWTWGSIFTLLLLSIFGACVVIGTLYDVISRKFRKEGGNSSLKTTVDNKGNHGDMSGDPNANHSDVKDNEELDSYHKIPKSELDGAVEKGGSSEEDGNNQETALNENSSTESCHPAEVEAAGKEPTMFAGITDMFFLIWSGSTPMHSYFYIQFDDILRCFSLVENLPKLLNTQKKTGTLGALHGVRVLCILWIIWGHCNIYLRYGGLDNILYVLDIVVSQFWYRLTLKAPYAVDTFFMISGLLLTFLTLKHLATTGGKLNWLYFYMHRYCRLTPVYMLSIGVWISLLVHLEEGPYIRDYYQRNRDTCATYWWTNLLYINNFFSFPTKQCMPWSWYLANDWQFFFISPLFLVLLSKRKFRKFGVIALVAVTVLSGIVTAVLIGQWGFPVGNLLSLYKGEGTASVDIDDRVYAKPWTRIQTYTLGMLVGYILYRIKDQKYRIPVIKNLIGWTLSFAIMFALVFGLYSSEEESSLPGWFGAIWHGIDRILFTSCVAWIIFACVTGNGGPVNSFLSSGLFIPLSRLTYCCYLLHPMIINAYLYSKKVSFHWSHMEMVYLFTGSTVVSFCLALYLSLLVEGPVVGLLKVLLRKSKSP